MSLFKRVLREKRGFVIPLSVALVINVGVYAFVVHPLGVRSATAEDRAAAAALARQAAEREVAAAQALVSGKTRADEELATFYQKVLPADLAVARRITYARLPALARKANVRYEERSSGIDEKDKNARLGRLRTRMVLQGDYEGFRQFIYDLETTPEFIIIDDVTITQGDTTKPLTITLELSTYYRQGANGT